MFKHKLDALAQKAIDDLAGDFAIRLDELRAGTQERLDLQTQTISSLISDVKTLNSELTVQREENRKMSEDLAAVEQKLDELLKAQDVAARSIPGEKPQDEPLSVMPGHMPWSQRKRAREQASRSSAFIDKVKKGAATTEKPAAEVQNE